MHRILLGSSQWWWVFLLEDSRSKLVISIRCKSILIYNSKNVLSKCKRRTTTLNETQTTLGNGRPAIKGTCAICGSKKFQIIKKTGKGLLNTVLNYLPLPEMRKSLPKGVPSESVPGGTFENTGKYSYCSPFIKLTKRLSQCYHGVYQLDRTCLDHDMAYAKHSDTTGRNAADDVLAAATSK